MRHHHSRRRGATHIAAALVLAACSSDSSNVVDADGEDAAATLKTVEHPTGRGAPARASRFDRLNDLEVSVSPRRAAAGMAVAGAAPGTLVRSVNGAIGCADVDRAVAESREAVAIFLRGALPR